MSQRNDDSSLLVTACDPACTISRQKTESARLQISLAPCGHGGNLFSPSALGLFHSCVIQVVMGGGQEAMEVTTTSTRIGKFEAR